MSPPPLATSSGGLLSLVVAVVVLAGGCGTHYATPPPPWPRDARFGWLARRPVPTHGAACRDWERAFEDLDPHAVRHLSFPETDPARSCYAVVDHGPRGVHVGAPASGCAYPDAPAADRLEALAAELAARPDGAVARRLFACDLSSADRAAASTMNATALAHVAARARSGARWPYAAVIVPGYGEPEQGQTSLVGWRPGDACRFLPAHDQDVLGVNVPRVVRAAAALRGGVAPLVIVSGGAAHSRLIEAFAMAHVMGCLLPVHANEIMVEPCADHTHTNLRNAGRWLVAMGGRTAYLLTDDTLQADYLQDWNGFHVLAGSVDRRSLRDWGYLLGAWRQASRGVRGGFWYTPYRFWAEPRAAAGSLTCLE